MTADSSSDITDLSATSLVTPKWHWQSLHKAVPSSPQISPAEKAISRSGLHYLGPPQPSLPPASNGPTKELRTCVDWTENAVNGDHLWMETSCSGELCYLGEDTCVQKTKSAPRRKCAACKIVVHTGCMEQLEKVMHTHTHSHVFISLWGHLIEIMLSLGLG
uniref:Phorbol-ester/DAG-type domain-containing protein n=1 Tax=Oreochromis aureus TaxID=47969 RepID=A0AAZ1XB55_OREAU